MSKNRNFTFLSKTKTALLFGIFLAFAGVILAQSAAAPAQGPEKTLVVNGKSAGEVVREIDGHTYVDVEVLAHFMNGSVKFDASRILLTIPVTNPVTTAANAPVVDTSAPVTRGLSTDFKRAAIAELSEMREWRGAVGAMITYGLAASDAAANDYHDRCEDGLNQAAVVVTTDADRSAMTLLKNQFNNMTAWANQIFAERKALNGARTVSPSRQQNDSQLQAITACGRFLNTMIVSGSFADDSSCH